MSQKNLPFKHNEGLYQIQITNLITKMLSGRQLCSVILSSKRMTYRPSLVHLKSHFSQINAILHSSCGGYGAHIPTIADTAATPTSRLHVTICGRVQFPCELMRKQAKLRKSPTGLTFESIRFVLFVVSFKLNLQLFAT